MLSKLDQTQAFDGAAAHECVYRFNTKKDTFLHILSYGRDICLQTWLGFIYFVCNQSHIALDLSTVEKSQMLPVLCWRRTDQR